MSFVLVLKELWGRRLLVAAAGAFALVVAVAAVYNVSFSPPGLSKRDHREAQGSIEVLVDSAKSPIADVARELEPLTARAGVFARYMAGGTVVKRIAEDTGISVKQIQVAGPVPLPGEAIGAGEAPPDLLPYGIEVVQRDELPIVTVNTRAPTVSEARELAAAAPAAVSGIVASIQRRQGVPDRKRVTFRVLGPARAAIANEAHGAKVAVLIFVILFTLLVLLILAVPRLIAAWRAVEDPARHAAYPPPPQGPAAIPISVHQAPEPGGPRALASASIAAADEIAERARLEVSGPGKHE
jgi:hypothetical protein